MKLAVEYEPQIFIFDIDDEDYGDFLESGLTPEAYFDAFVSDTTPEFNARIISI